MKHLSLRFRASETGKCFCEREAVDLSKSYYKVERLALVGEHTEYVCREILKISVDEFVNLLTDGVFD
jgi:hypothetical protein